MRALAVRRGCGTRKAGGVYLDTGLSPYGSPIETFLFDPPLQDVPQEWLRPHRNPILVERPSETDPTRSVWHVVIWVGAEYWPNVWDYIEEVRAAGSSRRVSALFDFSKLSAETRQFFVHGESCVQVQGALPPFDFHCPKVGPHRHWPTALADARTSLVCLGAAKHLASPIPEGYSERQDEAGRRFRQLPCGASYECYVMPPAGRSANHPGVFMALPLTGICCVRRGDGSVADQLHDRAALAQVPVYVADY